MLIHVLSGTALGYVIWTLFRLESNFQKVRCMKVPILRIPIDPNSILWVIFQPLVWKLLGFLPIPWSSYPDFVRFSHRNWHFLEKSSPGRRFGAVWALVSPGGIHLHFSDPDAIQEILSRWRDFVRPVEKYQILAIFGPSILTVKLEDWPRHRKAVSVPFNQANTKFVWNETLRQTQSIGRYWESQAPGEIPDVQQDLRTLSMNVLAAVAFHEPYDFIGSVKLKDRKFSMESYRDCLYIVHKYLIFLMLVPYRFLNGRFVPRTWVGIGHAATSMKSSMVNVVNRESKALSEGKAQYDGIIPSLVRALDQSDAQQGGDVGDTVKKSPRRSQLSIDEILGNVFVMNIAGHDTTANTLSFIVMRLAANPDVQDWLREELTTVIGDRKLEDWDYALFQDLKRCQAVLYETLRLYAPITGLPKIASKTIEAFHGGGDHVLTIPSGTEVFPMLLGIQTDLRYWNDPYTWRPSRWILLSDTMTPDHYDGKTEQLFVPPKGTYFPWSEGPQNCIGMKFSQAEVVAFLACLFKEHRVRPSLRKGETEVDARKRAQKCADDVNYDMLLKMSQPSRVKLVCERV
ncbi:cytochrome P450, putative [Talaromyces stipitatus ATCC 10500]|uniref:Cytochrome P450, putative n=1 Tax=Talaromyces stipitatus (strain ATCC 10500 / CBS 375.48 / QM 6759 / NRRL 1006) TaxID=441959 RepID=B8LYZ4_TALSN|nr:cytochrome P450, putative [Talaromyces stipitatus ATCC 10500]EED23502.1 cytochrome P450, putative [Talaromyces stipitatus ATCC 10500]